MQNIKFLFIGDVVARPGRRTVQSLLPKIRSEEKIDVVIANVENLAGGKGINRNGLYELIEAGVDYFTSGNHVFFRGGWEELLDDQSLGLLRPINYPADIPGRGQLTFKVNDQEVRLVNLQGTHGIDTPVENPFFTMDHVLEGINPADFVIVDFHAETSSEKRAMGFYLDGRVNAFIGSHTHVPTADLQVLPKGMFYVTDLGMTGSLDSVLGVQKDIIINRYTKPYPSRFEWEYGGRKMFNAVVLEIDETKKSTTFSRVDRIIP